MISDFSVVNVARNSHSAKPLIYKISGVWGNHEGSMLLWVLILALFGAAVRASAETCRLTLKRPGARGPGLDRARLPDLHALTSNPFERAFPPRRSTARSQSAAAGPGLAFHPPMLYIGYVGFSIAFSFAVAALIEGRVDAAWARWVRPWTTARLDCS